MKLATKRHLAVGIAVVSLGLVLIGCGKKDDTVDKTPPVTSDARADPANPGKMGKLPGAVSSPTATGK